MSETEVSRVLTEKDNKKPQNRKNHEEKITVKKLSQFERQKIVYLLDLQGFSNKGISEKLDVSLSTVEKDLHQIKEKARDWFFQLNLHGMGKSLADACVQIDEAQKELWRICRNTDDENIRIKTLNSIANLTMKKKELFWTTQQDPYYHGYGKESYSYPNIL